MTQGSNVVDIGCITRLDIPPERVIAQAATAGLEDVVVIGLGVDGSEYFASSTADGSYILWMIERLKMKLLHAPDA